MKNFLLLILFLMMNITVSCCLLFNNPPTTHVKSILDSTRNSLLLYIQSIDPEDVVEYDTCVKNAYIIYYKKYYKETPQKEIPSHAGSMLYYISHSQNEYIKTKENASPYNYRFYVDEMKQAWQGIEVPEPPMRFLRDLTSIQYEQCGENVYTIEERCAALAAVDIRPDWCKKGL